MKRALLSLPVVLCITLLSCSDDSNPVEPSLELTRPIADFINAQGTTTHWSPYGDEIAFAENPSEVVHPNAGWFDFLGLAEKYYRDHGGPIQDTRVTGSVSESTLAVGRLVQVEIHTENAIAWAIKDWQADTSSWTSYPTTIGAREEDVMQGATPALGECDFVWIFSDSNEIGSPLPDMAATMNAFVPWPYIEWYRTVTFFGAATGPLHAASGFPEGATGTLSIAQIGHCNDADQWPMEKVKLELAEATYPITDFLNEQGKTTNWQTYGDEIAWMENPAEVIPPEAGWFDLMGLAEKYYREHGGPVHNTVITGSVTQTPMEYGRLVHITMHTENAIAWAIPDHTADPDAFVTGPLTIGAREEAVMDGATPALGNCDFEWIFTDSNAVGSTLPDMAATMNGLIPWPYVEWYRVVTLRATARGPLHESSGFPEGTQGELFIAEEGYCNEADQWPVEVVTVTKAP
jgi:hypothetical protein